jgi:hypothetical protein
VLKSRRDRIILVVAFIAGCSGAALAADTITGVVRNQTRGRLAAGDEVILLRLDQSQSKKGMWEEARTQTDAQGSFAIEVPYPDRLHLVRVVHQGVNYDHRASVREAVSIDVFDAAARVQDVTGSIEIIRIGTHGNLLHVSDMIEIRNDSSPPRTQAGEHTFEMYLPAHAKIDSVFAAGPSAGAAAGSETTGVMISAASVPGEPEHYSVNFPLRPGATKFAFNYDLPYDGKATFRTGRAYPLQQLAVMIPPTIKFTSASPAFQALLTGNNSYQVEAANQVKAGEGPTFEISGVGALPALRSQAKSPPQPSTATLPSPALSAAGSSAPRAQSHSIALSAEPSSGLFAPPSWLRWWVAGASAVLLLGVYGFLLGRGQRLSANAITADLQKSKQPGQSSASVVEALKEELNQIETERSHGTLSWEEYAAAKQALEETVQRASARAGLS